MGFYVTYTAWLPTSPTTTGQSLIPGLSSTALNTATVNKEILKAEGLVNSFIGRRWLPSAVQTAPAIIAISEDITTYYLNKRLYTQDGGINENEDVVAQYNLALNLLEMMRDGTQVIYDSDGNSIGQNNLSNRIFINTRNYKPTFDEADEHDWRVSTRKLDDISDAKLADRS
jgi:phage gp36-like protein